MRWLVCPLILACALGSGCKRKAAPVEAEAPVAAPNAPAPPPVATSDATKLLKQLAKTKRAEQLATADRLAELAESDPAVIPGLVELLKDKTDLGEGQVLPNVPNGVREAAVMALLRCGEAGEKAALERGLPILLTGLSDAAPSVREHTLLAIARLGPKAVAAVPKVWPLAEDPSAFVRDSAYHCVRELGVKSAPQVVALLTHTDAGVRLTAAEQLPSFKPLPTDSVDPLRKALADPDKSVRTAAAEGLLDFGAKAASAAPDAVAAMRKSAKEAPPDPSDSLDFGLPNLLVAIGVASVDPVGKLLAEKDPLLQFQALYVLGELGPLAKAAVGDVEKAMNRDGDDTQVRLEACRALATITGDGAKSAPLLKLALAHKEPGVRNLGLQAIGRMGALGRTLADQVFPLLDDPEPILRKRAIAYVGTLDAAGRGAAVPRLAKLLMDEVASVRTAAVNALADLGPGAAGAADALARAAAGDDDAEVRQTALAALAELGAAGASGKASLLATIDDVKASDDIRGTALTALMSAASASPEAPLAVAKLLREKSPELRDRAARVAPRLRPVPVEIVARLGDLAATDPNVGVRARSIRALAEIGPAAKLVRDKVAPLTASPIAELSRWAKIALARIDADAAGLEKSIREGAQGKFGERIAALEAIGRLIPAAEADFADVEKLSRVKDATIRRQAAEALGRFGPSPVRAVPRLVEMLADRDEDVQLAAIRSLARFPMKDAASAVAPLKLKGRGDTRIARAARRAISGWEPAD